jgi:hypothetical protein
VNWVGVDCGLGGRFQRATSGPRHTQSPSKHVKTTQSEGDDDAASMHHRGAGAPTASRPSCRVPQPATRPPVPAANSRQSGARPVLAVAAQTFALHVRALLARAT